MKDYTRPTSGPSFYLDSDRTIPAGNGYYCDPKTGERLKVTYKVKVAMRATHEEQVEVEAYTEQEALQIAMNEGEWIFGRDWEFNKVDIWNYQGCELNSEFLTVDHVECDEPPAGSVYIACDEEDRK